MKLKIDSIYGEVPVQAEGTLDGVPFYFRARGNRWSLSLGNPPLGEDAWRYEEPYGETPYTAGWISKDLAEAFIYKAISIYLLQTIAD